MCCGEEPGDELLMAQACEGDADAFAALVRRHRPRVERFLYRLCWDEEEARDGAQETFIRVWLGRRRYREHGALTNYLYVVARNWWHNRNRAVHSHPHVVALEDQLGPCALEMLQDLRAAAEPAEATSLRRWELQKLRSGLSQLPEPQRLALILGHLEGLPYQQVAAILDVPVGTVKSRIHHAIRRLQKAWQEPEEEPTHALRELP